MIKKGFTFVETLVVISIFSLILPIILSILFIILQQQLRINSLTEVKRQGDFIADYLQNTISDNAYTIYDTNGTEICEVNSIDSYPHFSSPMPSILFRDKFNSEFSINYSAPNLSIDYSSPPVAPAPTLAFAQGQLNSPKVIIDTFSISCNRQSSFSAPLVSLNFRICYNISGSCSFSDPQKVVSLDYQTNIKLRSFPTE
ncbi:hypothetical protein A2954_00225 [Candidatus Roizmanbacteria bacterium RIFCSPLOWO2_01_FULL_37_12]|uniref:Type II secretion system protein n=1 Tax=Candidatus Roizmanbacteria bacterium RIFCSPLOWO2_01_FULL_37_12 TaxID=1802056 RepID=A0A1F7IB58_9BACT|nr:MAG: hypothetical protein A2768_00560 [Candidatus Roizmanbacteria bacterium RIFCSPHIGHO2_01_FULL_37_16]OGK24857.1 MAG: hypothetical protein A3D76_07045 [Candidatus Roizmanbacteria bacterium RIFCSPHIGHO2_02_FULL_37_9b]OGK40590.1 MAG: hypothetical protein A2954_00225 [Candidatus Roizmanbacteria bacterium RIFCSPLOWO2_01_FULL_37_12]